MQEAHQGGADHGTAGAIDGGEYRENTKIYKT